MYTPLAYTLIDLNKPVFHAFALWSAVLALKMMYLSMHTAFYRFKNKTFANAEDIGDARRVRFNDDQVERVRRAHRNDMENILPSLVIGLLYVLTNPSPVTASILFKVGAWARIVHTIVYAIVPTPQPSRVLSFAVHYFITIFMAVSVISHLW